MATSESTTKFKADISQLKSEMQAAARQVKLANSEFKAATAGMKDWKSNADGLEAKLKQLNTTLTSQKTQLSLLESELKATTAEYGENSSAADNVRIKINNQKAAIANTEAQIESYNQDLKDVENTTDDFANELDDAENEIEDTTSATAEMSEGFTVAKGVMADLIASGIKACVSALKELAEGAYEAYESFDEGQDIIVAKTGATGEALEELTDTYVSVMNSVITESDNAGNAIGTVATKFNLTGTELEELSTKFIKYAELNNTDVVTSINNVQSACAAWGIEAENAGDLLDLLNATGQETGASVDSLASSLTTNAASLKDMNLNIEESVAFLGDLETSGVDSSTVMAALKKALANAASEGKTTSEALAELQDAMESSDTQAEATVEAMELFGTKAGPAIAEACKSGRLNFTDLGKSMTDYIGNVDDTYEATQDGADKIKLAWQGMKTEVGALVGSILDDYAPDIEDILDEIKEGATSLLETVKQNGPQIKETLSSVIEWLKSSITWLIENFEGISTVVQAVGTVLVATFAVTKIVEFVTTISTMISTFAALKTATEAAETAQLLLNAAQLASPIGLVTAAVAGLAAGIIYLASQSEEYIAIEANLTESEQAEIDKVIELNNAYKDMLTSRDASVNAITEEYGYYAQLADELESIVDENGSVQESYEERANFIVTTLNEAVGTELELIDGVVQNYESEKEAIYDVIETKKANAILTANEEAYTTAIQNQNEALQDVVETSNLYYEKKAELSDLEEEYNTALNMTANEYAEINGLMPDMSYNSELLAEYQSELAEEVTSCKMAVGEAHVAMDKATETYENYETTIKNYEGLSSAIISGDCTKISAALDSMVNNFKTAETSTKATLEQQVTDYETNYNALRTAIQNGSPYVTQDMVDQAKSMVDAAKAELDKLPDEASESANNAANAYTSNLGSDYNKGQAASSASGLRDSANSGLAPNGEEKSAADNFTKGYLDSITGKYTDASEKGKRLSSSAVSGLNTGQDSHSPSTYTTTSGENFGQGYINGMDNKSSSIYQKAYALAQKALAGLNAGQKSSSPSKLTKISGGWFGEGYSEGMLDTAKDVVAAATTLAVSAVASLSDTDAEKTGADLVAGFIDGIEGMTDEFDDSISSLGKGSFVKGIQNLVSNAKEEINGAFADNSVFGEVSMAASVVSGSLGTNNANKSLTNITNNYNMNQVNNSPKSLSALETFQARRQQISLLKTIM
jgi:phage-related minor tail protein